jgi:hypothetical protein
VFLRKLTNNGVLAKMQNALGTQSYEDRSSVLSNAITIAALGAIFFVVTALAASIFGFSGKAWAYIPYACLIVFPAAAAVYYIIKKLKVAKTDDK